MNKNKIKGYIAWIIFAITLIWVVYQIALSPIYLINLLSIFMGLTIGKIIGKWMININKKEDDVNE